MDYIADLHIHSSYAMACARNITLRSLINTADHKGISIVGTGDFTHPKWISEMKNEIEEEREGIYALSKNSGKARFVLSAEVCTIFDKLNTVKKIHNCILAPNLEVVEQISSNLEKFGSLSSDGRPILNMSAAELVEILHGISKDILVFPAHAWTPHFGVFGAFSGFDHMADAFEDQAMHIHAFEMGLSSDALMNYRISENDKYTLLSNSDAHSLPKMGREANVFSFDKDPEYKDIIDAIVNKDRKKIKMNIGFYPEEGKYHNDGHRNCRVSMTPQESKIYNGRCPVCGGRITIGVLHRIDELADREYGYIPKGAVPYVHSMLLDELIAYIMEKTTTAKAVKELAERLVYRFGTEFDVMLNADINEVAKIDAEVAKAVENIREEKVNLIPGYDGVFGIVDIMGREREKMEKSRSGINQRTLFDK